MIKRIFAIGLVVIIALGMSEPFFASNSSKIEEEKLYEAYTKPQSSYRFTIV